MVSKFKYLYFLDETKQFCSERKSYVGIEKNLTEKRIKKKENVRG